MIALDGSALLAILLDEDDADRCIDALSGEENLIILAVSLAKAMIVAEAVMLGTISQMGEKQAIIEIAPGIEMTVMKQAILRVVTASEEEFEYEDEGAEAPTEVPAASAPDVVDEPRVSGSPAAETGFERPDKPENTSH